MNPLLVLTVLTPLAAQAAPVTPKVSLDRDAVITGQDTSVFLLLELEGASPKQSRQRRPLNVSLVVDRSGSMDGKKLDYALVAARRLIDMLDKNDFVSLVEYDDEVTTLWPASRATSTDMLKRRLRGLTPRGGTNLTGGMMAGAEEVTKNVSKERISRVILLSDGNANEGITAPQHIARLVRAKRTAGAAITTMGLGDDYNEDLMEMIAENGGGRYYFIEHPEQLARIFEEEMSILAKSVAKNVRVRFDAGSLVTKAEVFGYPAKANGARTTVTHEDVFAGETRSMLVRLDLKGAKPGTYNLGTMLLEYLDIETGRAAAIEKEIRLKVTADRIAVDAARNERVIAESTLIEADIEQRATTKMYERGKKKQAKSRLKRMGRKLARIRKRTKDKRLAKKAAALRLSAADMDASDASPVYKKKYLKRSKSIGGLGTRGKRTSYLLDESTSGYMVELLQTELKKRGFFAGKSDGSFSPAVAAAVSKFQAKQGLEVDGIAGPDTLRALGLY